MADPTAPPPPPGTFAFDAQAADGRTFRGTLDAPAIATAADQLAGLHLRVTRLEPIAAPPRAPLGESDFLFVNRQLSHLTAGGLPIERGLRLIADELPRRQARAVRAVAADLEAGTPIGDAFAGRGGTFPASYGRLLDAGVRANNLPGVLVNLGRHVELVQRLRAAVWRAAAYPLIVAVVLLGVLTLIWGYILPRLALATRGIVVGYPRYWYARQQAPDPAYWSVLPPLARAVSYAVMGLLVAVLVGAAVAAVLSRSAGGRRELGPVLLRLPVVGPVVRWNAVARWCDALHLAVAAGLDLPAALDLAGQSVDLDAARADSAEMRQAVQAGRPLDGLGPLRLLPPTVPTALSLGVAQNDLPAAAGTLARLYQEQAEVRLAVLPQVLSPALLLATALCVGLAIATALVPLMVLFHSISGP